MTTDVSKVSFRHLIPTLSEQFVGYEKFIGDENFNRLMQQRRINRPNIWEMFEFYLGCSDIVKVANEFDCEQQVVSVQINNLIRLLRLSLVDYSLAIAYLEVGETHPSSDLFGIVRVCVAEDGYDDSNFLDLTNEQIEEMMKKPRVNEQAVEAIKIAQKIFIEEQQRRNV